MAFIFVLLHNVDWKIKLGGEVTSTPGCIMHHGNFVCSLPGGVCVCVCEGVLGTK